MKNYNLIVAGGGLSGVAAAVSAARLGMRVLLIEKSGALGGAMSNSLVFPFMPYWTMNGHEKKYLSTGIFAEMMKRQAAYTHNTNDSNFDPEYFKIVLDDMVTEARVDVLFHAMLFEVQKDGRYIKSVSVATKSGSLTFEANFFIDTTGDGVADDGSLRGSSEVVAGRIRDEIQSRVNEAGIEIIEARITYLAYATEIAAVMLQRQQASAVIDARKMIVDGAGGMVEMALERLEQNSAIKLDDERKAAMVSNLLVVLCGNKDAQPIVNSGSLY